MHIWENLPTNVAMGRRSESSRNSILVGLSGGKPFAGLLLLRLNRGMLSEALCGANLKGQSEVVFVARVGRKILDDWLGGLLSGFCCLFLWIMKRLNKWDCSRDGGRGWWHASLIAFTVHAMWWRCPINYKKEQSNFCSSQCFHCGVWLLLYCSINRCCSLKV